MDAIETENKIDPDSHNKSREELQNLAFEVINDIKPTYTLQIEYQSSASTVQSTSTDSAQPITDMSTTPVELLEGVNQISSEDIKFTTVMNEIVAGDSDGDGIPDNLDSTQNKSTKEIHFAIIQDSITHIIKLSGMFFLKALLKMFDTVNNIGTYMIGAAGVQNTSFDPKTNKGAGDLSEKINGVSNDSNFF